MHASKSRFGARASLVLVVILLFSAVQLGPAVAAPGGAPRGSDFFNPGGYLTGPASGDALDIAMAYVRGHKADLGVIDDDLTDVVVKDRYMSPNNGITHLYLRQRLDGIEVFNGDINVNVTRDGRILNLGNWFVGNLRSSAKTRTAKLNQIAAVKSAAKYLGLTITETLRQLNAPSGKSQKVKLSRGGISKDDIPVELLYLPLDSGEVRLTWDITLRLKDSKRWLSLRADAVTGDVLSEVNWVADAGVVHGVEYVTDAQYSHIVSVANSAQGVTTPPSTVNDGSSYLVYPLPYEDPAHTPGQQQISVSNPADALASPFGWHDTNGAAGPEYTITRGNNVHAYQDSQNIDHSSGDEPNGGAGLDFQLPIDLTLDPPLYRDASTVNLFYWNNTIHDIFYHYGFTEAVLLSDMVDNSRLPLVYGVYLFSDESRHWWRPLQVPTTEPRPCQAPIRALRPATFLSSGSFNRLRWQGPRQQLTNAPPPTRHSGRHRRGSLPVALGLALTAPLTWLP